MILVLGDGVGVVVGEVGDVLGEVVGGSWRSCWIGTAVVGHALLQTYHTRAPTCHNCSKLWHTCTNSGKEVEFGAKCPHLEDFDSGLFIDDSVRKRL